MALLVEWVVEVESTAGCWEKLRSFYFRSDAELYADRVREYQKEHYAQVWGVRVRRVMFQHWTSESL